MGEKIRIGALISGGGTNLQAIIDGCESGAIHGKMVFVGSDTPQAKGLERSSRHGIPNFVVDYAHIIRSYNSDSGTLPLPADFDFFDILSKQSLFFPGVTPDKVRSFPDKIKYFLCTRAIAEAQLLQKMKAVGFDLLVLAGFMRTLTPYFIDRVNLDPDRPRIMNIHPALLPAFPGTDGYGDTVRYGCKVGGCTVHFVDYGEDSGSIIGQRAFSINPGDTVEDVRQKGLKEEWRLYPECIDLFARNRLQPRKEILTTGDGKKSERMVIDILPPSDGDK